MSLALTFLSAGTAQALMLKLSLEELGTGADTIIIGTVVETNSQWNAERTNIYTTVVVSVEDTLKGTVSQDAITITVPGGEADGIKEVVSDMPSFQVGERAVLFLEQLPQAWFSEPGLSQAQLAGAPFRVYGCFQGKFPVEEGRVGKLSLAAFKEHVSLAVQGEHLPDEEGAEPRVTLAPQGAASAQEGAGGQGEDTAYNSISAISPNIASAGTDTQVTISGSGFGATQGTSEVWFYYRDMTAITADDIVSWTDTSIDVIVPTAIIESYPASAGSGPAIVVLPGNDQSNYWPFTVTFGYGDVMWPGASPTVSYKINENTTDCTGEGAAVQAAMATWTAAANFSFSYAGTTSITSRVYDGTNAIFWKDSGAASFLAANSYWYSGSTLVQTDIEFNDYYAWSAAASPPGGQYDVETTALHELGHSLNLRDLYGNYYTDPDPHDSNKVMYGYGSAGESKRSLHAHDQAGIQWIYGAATPPTVTTSGHCQVTDTSVRMLGDLTNLGSASSVGVSFMYGTTTDCTDGTSYTKTFSSPIYFGIVVSGLSPGTTYHFKAKAAGDGTSYGNVMSFTTTGGGTPPTITTSGSCYVTDTSVRMLGDLTNLGSASSVGVSFMYGTTEDCADGTSYTKTFSSPIYFGIVVSGLSPGTTYHFKAKAVGNGTSYGDVVSFTTTSTPPTVSTHGYCQLTDTSVRMLGDLTDLGSASSVGVSFMYGTTEDCDQGTSYTKTFSSPIYFGIVVYGLSPGTTYYFKAKAAGDGTSYGSVMNFTTTGGATPPTVSTSGHCQVTDTSVRMLGDLTDLGSASSVGVSFMYGTTEDCTDGTSYTKTFSSPIYFGIVVSGLSPGTTYHFKAKAVGDGTSYGDVLSFTTAGGPAITTSGHCQVTDTSVRMLGDLTDLGSASSARVSFMYGTTPDCTDGTSSGKTFTSPIYFGIPVSGLSPGTTYHFKAKAVGDGTSYGEVMSFSTTGGG